MLLSSVLLSLVLCLSLEEKKAHADIIDGEWLIKKGGVDSTWLTDLIGDANESVKENPNFLHIDEDITLENARKWCAETKDCVAFSFNIKSRKSMYTLDSVFYLFDVEDASRGDFSTRPWFSSTAAGWVTHVLHEEGLEWNDDAPECQSSDVENEGKHKTSEEKNESGLNEEEEEEKKEEPEQSDAEKWWEEESQWNEEVQKYDKEASPYQHCCHRVDDKEWIPSIEKIQEMETIQRISCDISREEFVEKYESKRTPVILEGCDKDWPGKENWNFQTLIPRFHNETKWRDCDYKMITWSQVQERIANNTLCIFHKIDTEEKSIPLRQNYTIPPAFQNADIFRHLIDVNNPSKWFSQYPIASFSLRTSHALSWPHQDCTLPSIDNWNTLVTGHVWWVLFPDTKILSHTHAVHCNPECSEAKDTLSWYATVGINAHKLVFEDGARPMQILQGPGDTVYVPDRWLHALMSLDEENVAVTHGYSSEDTNFERVWKEVLAWGDEEDWDILYNKVFTEEQRELARETIKGDVVCVSNSAVSCIGENTYCDYSSFHAEEVWEDSENVEEDYHDETFEDIVN